MTYAVFLKHEKTGDTAVIHSPGDCAQDAVARISPALGVGWEATGALVRIASEKSASAQNKFKAVTFSDGPTPDVMTRLFSSWETCCRATPHYTIFDLDRIWSSNNESIPGHFVFVRVQMVLDGTGQWSYIEWEYNLGLEGIANVIYNSRNGHLVYAVYEKVDEAYSAYPGLYKLVLTRDM